jgi:serine/threonine protein phosphatase 1
MRRRRMRAETWPAAVYAIGDVHGCHEALAALERVIVTDGASRPGEKWIVMLGDYIDRGPQASGVISHLIAPAPPGFRRVCLLGNHEQMMLDFLDDPALHAYWVEEGGLETLASYGVATRPARTADDLRAEFVRLLPIEHRRFIASLPIMLALPGWLFVHAGLRPGVPIDRQSEEDLIWIREPFLSGRSPRGYRVVHGHTPADEPEILPHRIGIDTHCFASGRLTGLRVTAEGETVLFTVQT